MNRDKQNLRIAVASNNKYLTMNNTYSDIMNIRFLLNKNIKYLYMYVSFYKDVKGHVLSCFDYKIALFVIKIFKNCNYFFEVYFETFL